MSLKVWLPLTKDLRNQGLANITSSGTPVFKNSGKLGSKSLDLNTRINFSCPALNNVSTFSVAFWAKINQDSNISGNWMDVLGLTDISISGSGGQLRWETCYTLDASTRGISAHDNTTYATVQGPSGQATLKGNWNHFCITVDPSGSGRAIEYWDGVKIDDYAANGGHLNGNFWIGETNKVNGEIQDVRIYDHCLSPMEVKELSKGLVLHYPLNRGGWGQENLLKNTNVSVTNGSKTGFVLSQTIPSGTKVTFSLQIDAIDLVLSGNKRIGLEGFQNNGTNNSYKGVWISGVNAQGTYSKRIFATVTLDRDFLINNNTFGIYIQTVSSGSVTISNPKIEIGEKATPWCPNSSDALATTMELNNNVEYDTSGYENNGEYYAYDTNGSISYTSDTPKYNVSTHIASANPTQSAASGTRYLYGHCELTNPTQMSVAFWLKPITGGYGSTTSNGQGYFCTTNYEYGNISVGSDYQASAMNHRDGTVDMNDSASTTQCRVYFYPTIGEWHHYVYTYDGQVGRGYRDGVQTDTAQFSTAKTLDSFIGVVIGFSKAGGVWRRNDACYSDFRIYATALSAEDVKDLYELGAAIDTNNILYTYELNEV